MKLNKKKLLTQLSSSLHKYYGDKDFQFIFSLSKSDKNSAEIIQVLVIPGRILNDVLRMEKVDVLNGKTDAITERRLHAALNKLAGSYPVAILQEFVTF